MDNLDGPFKKEDDGGIEFEGVHIDDDPTAGMVVMRGFLFLPEDVPQIRPVFKIDATGCDDSNSSDTNNDNSLTTQAINKSSRRVTLFEGKLSTSSISSIDRRCCSNIDLYVDNLK